jgi:hypothetical protein
VVQEVVMVDIVQDIMVEVEVMVEEEEEVVVEVQ